MPQVVVADDIDGTLRRAETNARQAVTSPNAPGRAAAAQRAQSAVRGAKVSDAPFLGLESSAQRRTIDRVERQLDRSVLSERDARRTARSGLRPRTKLLDLGPREITLDPEILNE